MWGALKIHRYHMRRTKFCKFAFPFTPVEVPSFHLDMVSNQHICRPPDVGFLEVVQSPGIMHVQDGNCLALFLLYSPLNAQRGYVRHSISTTKTSLIDCKSLPTLNSFAWWYHAFCVTNPSKCPVCGSQSLKPGKLSTLPTNGRGTGPGKSGQGRR